MAKLTEWKIVVCKCLTHPDLWMIVWGEHTSDPGEQAKRTMRQIMEILFPGIKLRGPGSIPEHFHYHEASQDRIVDLKIEYVYVINSDLKMSKGKIAAQVAHVAMMLADENKPIGKAIVLKAEEKI